jgi:hypothetical protein
MQARIIPLFVCLSKHVMLHHPEGGARGATSCGRCTNPTSPSAPPPLSVARSPVSISARAHAFPPGPLQLDRPLHGCCGARGVACCLACCGVLRCVQVGNQNGGTPAQKRATCEFGPETSLVASRKMGEGWQGQQGMRACTRGGMACDARSVSSREGAWLVGHGVASPPPAPLLPSTYTHPVRVWYVCLVIPLMHSVVVQCQATDLKATRHATCVGNCTGRCFARMNKP